MASERIQRRLERLLDQIDEAEANGYWESVHDLALDVLAIDAENAEAKAYLEAAERRFSRSANAVQQPPPPLALIASDDQPTAFANGRYQVKKFLGEGGKKKVYLAQDTLLDREVAFALIKTEGLDDVFVSPPTLISSRCST